MKKGNKWTKLGDAALATYWNHGYSAPQIAEMMNRTPAAIYLRARKIGLERRMVKLTREQRDEAWADLEEIAKKLKCAPHNIVNQLHREWYGLK